ncbi:MAG: alpha-mannosidase [Fimbriimonadia bacterium]|jgi:alpha-mannosidase
MVVERMHKHPDVTVKRLRRFLSDRLVGHFYGRKVPLSLAVSQQQGIRDERAARAARFLPVEPGFRWGPVWSTAWFRITGNVPEEWNGENVLAAIDLGAETTVWWNNAPREGLDRNHRYHHYEGGPEVDLIAEAYAINPLVSDWGRPKDPPATPCEVGECFLFLPDARLWSYYHDFRVALGLLEELPRDEPRFGRLLYAMNESVNAFSREGIDAATEVLREEWYQPACASAHKVSAIGHAHIDTAWLWPLHITMKKCAHTFSTATRYMELYPDYKFLCSQAAQYEWIREQYPGLFERIKEMVKRGQWEPTGSMWVEADCNVPSGESLVRQFLYGKRYFLEHFGVETKDMWLPDVFGYSAALPQILKLAGVDYFLTQKICWNDTNVFPHHTFRWKGIDGTEVLSHFMPANDYCCNMTPKQLLFSVHNFKEHGRSDRSLYVYGYGDGGGGPTVDMIEAGLRMRDVEGLPRVEMEFARDFLRKTFEEARDLATWWGELYFELHRGTYTTQATNKKHNRKCELLLRDAEMLASLFCGASAYPRDALEEAWKLVLLNQFHDILPGSSIEEVYRDSDRDYTRVYDLLRPVVDGVVQESRGEHVALYSTREAGFGDLGTVRLAGGKKYQSIEWAEGGVSPLQQLGEEALFAVPPFGIGRLSGKLSETVVPASILSVDERTLENEHLAVRIDDAGSIASLVLKASDQQVVAEGRVCNEIQLLEDVPNNWEAWDIDLFSHETVRSLPGRAEIEVVEHGPVRAAVRVTKTFGSSRIVQDIRLAASAPFVEFATTVDWHEDRKMLKAAFPVRVNSPRATYEIQFGHVERPTHYNTSWDQARFEVCGHKWADLSEGGWGVALINDCKYGHDTYLDTIRLTLLRAPQAPDPTADRGTHHFTYWLYPHLGDFRQAGVVTVANRLNSPVRCVRTASPVDTHSFLEITAPPDGPKLVVETLKRAEGSNDLILRLYEAHNARGKAGIRFGFPVVQAQRCDLLERAVGEAIEVRDGTITLDVRPFEIITLKLGQGLA